MATQIKHYMQRIDKVGYNIVDLESEYPNLRYLKADGINNIGKAKNVYTEDYADDSRLRVYVPEDDHYANEAVTVTMTFCIFGKDAQARQETYDNFTDYVRKGIHRYWDTKRNREFEFIVTEEITVSDEMFNGSMPYIEVTIPCLNINGTTRFRG